MRKVEAVRVRSGSRGERGQVLILFVLMLAVLLGFVALAIDVGLFYEDRRSSQNATDAAALAAAQDLFNGTSVATAKATATSYLSRNGYQSPPATISVNIPPASGPHTGDSHYVEVIVSTQKEALFRAPLSATPWTVKGRAVATFSVSAGANAAILVLNETKCQSFDASGAASLTINNDGGIVDNSSCDPAVYRNGSGTVSADGGIYFYKDGGYQEQGSGAFVPTPAPLNQRIADPLAGLVPPNFTTLGQSPDSGGTPANPSLKKLTSGTQTLRPGVYYGGLEIGSSATVILQDGTYVMAGGGFKIGGSANVTGSGITVYNSFDPQKPKQAGACASIVLVGSANYNLVAPTSGAYKDLLFWQDRACTNTMSFNGNGDNVGGIIYLPTAEVDLSGNAGLGSVQIISDSFNLSGSGIISVNFYPYLVIPISPALRLVE